MGKLDSLYNDETFKNNPLRKLDMIFKILSSVYKLHLKGIIHYELKEDNIYLINPFTPVIGEF